MGDVGTESTLVLDGLAVSKVRFYSILDSDVGKRIEITDKFNPLNVYTGTFDESLNMLYDLPAFTSYQVKMYGLDGETVESDQSFMLKGYDYLEINVGLNKNSFAGIKAIVDQGLEGSMIEIGHEFSEDDNVGDNGGRWIVVAKDADEFHRHSVFLARKYVVVASNYAEKINVLFNKTYPNTAWAIYLNGSYYNNLPDSIKNAIKPRNIKTWRASTSTGWQNNYYDDGYAEHKVWAASNSEVNGGTQRLIVHLEQNTADLTGIAFTPDIQKYPIFPQYAISRSNLGRKADGNPSSSYLRTAMQTVAAQSGNYSTVGCCNAAGNVGAYYGSTALFGTPVCPHVMIASGPIE